MLRRTLLVVYGEGSFAPRLMHEAARELSADLVFAVERHAGLGATRQVLEMFGTVVEVGSVDDTSGTSELRELRPDGIVTFAESQLIRTAMLAEQLGLPYQPVSSMAAITHKLAQRQALSRAGLRVPWTRRVRTEGDLRSAIEDRGRDSLIKPTIGAGSRHTFSLQSDQNLALAHRLLRDGIESEMIVEELLVGRPTPQPWGDYVAMDFLVVDGTPSLVVTSDKFSLADPYRERGAFTRPRLHTDELNQIEDLCKRAISAVGFRHGMVDLEVKLTTQGPVVIEINGRMGAWVDFIGRRAIGISAGGLAMAYALGMIERPYERDLETAESTEIAFQYLALPPIGATQLVGQVDVLALRRVPGVEMVAVTTPPDGRISWREGTSSSVATLGGRASGHEQLADTVRSIDRLIAPCFGSAQV